MPCIVRPIGPEDAEAIGGIQAESPEIAQWSKGAYERLAQDGISGWVADGSDGVAGFITARAAGGEIEILNFAVRPKARCQGLGAQLLDKVLCWADTSSMDNIFLEVRESNQVARAFYERHGFREVGRRPRYYAAPIEDALLLALSLDSKASRG